MEKDFNSKHEVVLKCNVKANYEGSKNGDPIPHKRTVTTLSMYIWHEENKYIKQSFSKDFIIDLYNQIQDIEASEIILPFVETNIDFNSY